MGKKLPIPSAAKADPHSVEMIRVWIASQKLHCVLNIGMWEDQEIDEREAWGILLADMLRHIAAAHEAEYDRDPRESIAMVRNSLAAELDRPTSANEGYFQDE